MERPYLFNPEYLEALGESVSVPELNEINRKTLELYNRVKSEFAKGVSGYFEFTFKTYFGTVDEYEARYIQLALEKIHEIIKSYQKKQELKAEHYKKLRDRNGAGIRGIT